MHYLVIKFAVECSWGLFTVYESDYLYCKEYDNFQMISDLDFGAGMDFVVKQQCVYEDAYFYEFNYKSWNDWAPKWMGKKNNYSPEHSSIVVCDTSPLII